MCWPQSEGLARMCILLVFRLPRGQAAPAVLLNADCLSGLLLASSLCVRPAQFACTRQQKVIFTLDNNEVFLRLTTSMCSRDLMPFGKDLNPSGPSRPPKGCKRQSACALLLPGGDVLGQAAHIPWDSRHPKPQGKKEGGNASQKLWLQLVDGKKGGEG